MTFFRTISLPIQVCRFRRWLFLGLLHSLFVSGVAVGVGEESLDGFACLDLPVSQPGPVDEYRIHPDGGLIYDPIRREAEATGQLVRVEPGNRQLVTLELGAGLRAWAKAPQRIDAYGVAEIPYRLEWVEGSEPRFPVAVEAVAFEEPERRNGRDLFDLALPGRIDLDVRYLGSVTAHLIPGARNNIRPDMLDEPGAYPGFARGPLVRSGVIEAGDLVWFRFRVRNTGDTILKPEGFGGCQFYPLLKKRDASGEWVEAGGSYNLYVRELESLYPGESRDIWVHCTGSYPGYSGSGAAETPQGFGLTPGAYQFHFRMTYRCYETDEVFLNIWDGPVGYHWEMPFLVEEQPRQVSVSEGRRLYSHTDQGPRITRFVHTLEEFMTAFDCHLQAPETGHGIEGVLHLQVAPWTREIVFKVITTDPLAVRTAAMPVEIGLDALSLALDPDPSLYLIQEGLWHPVIASQSMADMRANVQIGPFPERHIPERMREMIDCGVNVVATTGMPWLYDDRDAPRSNYQGDAYKYSLEVARKEGLRVFGWGSYPFDRATVLPIAEWISGGSFPVGERTLGGAMIGMAEPNLPLANAVLWGYQARRWGDLYFQSGSGICPIDVEDTRGWLRQDIQIRYPMGDGVTKLFQGWLRKKYIDLDRLNLVWGSDFADWGEIRPEAGQVTNRFGHQYEYTDPDRPFHDWNLPVLDWDIFRTELRLRNYRDVLSVFREEVPNAVISVRTEGGNVLVAGLDPQSPNAHFRHIYYSQRRCGLIAEVVQSEPGLVRVHSDYTTMPYTPSEIRFLTRTAVAQGVVPCFFPQFNNMRDIAINARYGTEYGVHYNLPEGRKGMMMHVLLALYPWFKATYEEGGVPGILWEDYQCDGFATATQKREMRYFRQALERVLNRPESLDLRRVEEGAGDPDGVVSGEVRPCYVVEEGAGYDGVEASDE